MQNRQILGETGLGRIWDHDTDINIHDVTLLQTYTTSPLT